MVLFRPVGLKELELIAVSGFRAFPPRLAWQPIFYPVLNRDYAISIAQDWNIKDATSGFAGFVTEFDVEDSYVGRFPVQQVARPCTVSYGCRRRNWRSSTDTFVGLSESRDRITASFAGRVDPSSGLPVGMAVVSAEPKAAADLPAE